MVTFYLFENNWLTYASGAICGSAAAILWTSQGTYSVLNSENGDVHTTSCIFYIFFHARYIFINEFFILEGDIFLIHFNLDPLSLVYNVLKLESFAFMIQPISVKKSR